MTVFKTAYDTTACKGQALSKYNEALIRARTSGYIYPVENNKYIYAIRGGRTENEVIPRFFHPIVNEVSGEPLIYIDVRDYTKLDTTSVSGVVTNTDGYQAELLRAQLQEQWIAGNFSGLRNLRLPSMVFPTWISENISKQLNLDPGAQAKLTILASIYYFSLFNDWDSANVGDKTLMTAMVAKATNIKPMVVQEVVSDISYIGDVNDFCDAVKEHVKNVRLNNLNASTLYTIMKGSWYGNNAPELVAVALEHPPTFITLIWQAATSRMYYHAPLTKILERNSFKNEVRNFTIAVRG